MPTYHWEKVQEVLNDTEKNRLLCIFLAMDAKPIKEQIQEAAKEFGAAEGGFRQMYNKTMKKLKEKGAEKDSGDADA
ncbi:hypothetical protein EJ08DRAFT_652334 [Tothia fuscella]|uniref:Uncharacterized protein n=1 Tax=Tothia fuscella TaxID=1048955 RepID=A0A9P4TUY8_9PEZI|nr:hypothetical protein EJ08DRAFT_652334 [Tothia fuscella]